MPGVFKVFVSSGCGSFIDTIFSSEDMLEYKPEKESRYLIVLNGFFRPLSTTFLDIKTGSSFDFSSQTKANVIIR